MTRPTPFLGAAMRDARVTTDARGLMPLVEAREIARKLTRFEKAPSDASPVLGADLAWAALLSLEDAREFLDAALRITWAFHVRAHGNLAAHERYGDAILPWIAQALDDHGTLRNVPWCLYPCLLEIGTADALDVAFLVRRVDASLEPQAATGAPASDEIDLGAGPAWLAHRAPERIALVAARAKDDPRSRALLARSVAALGVASVSALRPVFGDDAAVGAALEALRIAVPRTAPEIEAVLADAPRADVPEGPPWSVVELDQDQAFPYWKVLSGYETPYAIRVHAFASADGDALFVQRVGRDERGSMPCLRDVGAYGPGATRFDRRAAFVALAAEEDFSGVHLSDGAGYVNGISEVVDLGAEADADGVTIPGTYRSRMVRNPMPHEGMLLRILGTDEDLTIPPQQPAAWAEVAERVAREGSLSAEAMLRSIDPAEQVLLRLVSEHRERLFLDEAQLRAAASLPVSAELLFVVDDPELPEIYADRPPSAVAPWPLLCEALRRRVRLDPARVPRVDVLAQRLAWTEGRGGADDCWGPETSPVIEPRPRGIGATPFHDELLARGWPHGVRLLHQHPHNESGPAIFDWLLAQPELPYRSYWPREIATRWLRHVGGSPRAREDGSWVREAEAHRILASVVARRDAKLTPLAAEHVVLLLEAMIGGPTLLESAIAILESLADDERRAPHPDGGHALVALGWVARRIRSERGLAAVKRLRALAEGLDRGTDLGRALDVAVGGDEGVRRSARHAEELALARDPAVVRALLGDRALPLDLQLALLLGDEALDHWERAELATAEAAWLAGELALLASPRAQALAAELGG